MTTEHFGLDGIYVLRRESWLIVEDWVTNNKQDHISSTPVALTPRNGKQRHSSFSFLPRNPNSYLKLRTQQFFFR